MARITICDICKEVIGDTDRAGRIALGFEPGAHAGSNLNINREWIPGSITLGNVCVKDFTEIRVVIENLLNRDKSPTAVQIK